MKKLKLIRNVESNTIEKFSKIAVKKGWRHARLFEEMVKSYPLA